MAEEWKKFTEEELRKYNGENGNPVYVAHEGRVIDVTESKMWRTGMHMKQHNAGKDLSGEIENAPHETDVLDRFPQVGILEKSAHAQPEASEHAHLPRILSRFLERFPFFERHPHPMTVHFPIVFMLGAPIFVLLYLISGLAAFEVTSVHLLGAGVLFSLVAIPTGFLTWWINYHARKVRAVTYKIILSLLLFFIGGAAFVWRLVDPTILSGTSRGHIVYLILVLSLLPIISLIGWFGATLTFPLHAKKKTEKVT